MELIKGKEIADDILENLRKNIAKLAKKPNLAVILIGDDEASKIYVNLKKKAANYVGMGFELFKYEDDIDESEILKKIDDLNNDNEVSGIIVQLPLPNRLDKDKIINAINPDKDVDGFHCENQRKFCCGDKCDIFPVFPKAIMRIIEESISKNNLRNLKRAIIVCMSEDFGIIMQEALRKIGLDGQYIFCDKLLDELERLKSADVIVTACGRVNLIKKPIVKEGVIIVDGGIVKLDGKVVGDVDIKSFDNFEAFISPVPGGVGPVTVACLLENTFLASNRK